MSDSEFVPPLLAPADPAAFVRVRGTEPRLVIVCDHAGRAIPRRLATLGLARSDLDRHIGWDIGACDVARALADRFAATLIASVYSRLVCDANRYVHDPDFIRTESDGTRIPGNEGITPSERQARIEEIYRPYHDAIRADLEGRRAQGTVPVLVSIHSMTNRMNGRERTEEIAILWDKADDRAARVAFAVLGRDPTLMIGDNTPYSLDPGIDFTVPEHALYRGLPHLMVEFRQDLIATPDTAAAWAERFAPVVEAILAAPECGSVHQALS